VPPFQCINFIRTSLFVQYFLISETIYNKKSEIIRSWFDTRDFSSSSVFPTTTTTTTSVSTSLESTSMTTSQSVDRKKESGQFFMNTVKIQNNTYVLPFLLAISFISNKQKFIDFFPCSRKISKVEQFSIQFETFSLKTCSILVYLWKKRIIQKCQHFSF
jgi:hypothetical protein